MSLEFEAEVSDDVDLTWIGSTIDGFELYSQLPVLAVSRRVIYKIPKI